uniref:fimbrillin family protein n=1 Tax=Alloprevotella sp. TaxID=1872471 RepID=UPI004026D587
MKQTKFILAGAVAALTLSSCSNNLDDNSSWGSDSQNVKFSSYIEGQKTVKASGTTWTTGDKVGIFMKKAGADLGAATAANKQFITDDRGTLTAAAADQALAYPEGAVDFVAYYPYTASVTENKVAVDVKNQSKPEAIDLLYSNNATNVTASANAVNLGFKHQLATVRLNIKAQGIASTAGLTATLTGSKTAGSFNLADGSLAVTDASAADIAFTVNAAGTQAEAIVLPQNAANVKVKFTLNGKTVEQALPAASAIWAAGNRYAIDVTLKGESTGEIYVNFGQATITDWTDVPGGNINVDFNGGTVEPGTGTETVIFEETFGASVAKVNNYWPSIYDMSNWSNTSGMTFKDPIATANGWKFSSCSVRQTSALKPHVWFAANKESSMEISGFTTAGYKTLTLSYKFASQDPGAKQEDLVIKMGETVVTVPAGTTATANTFQDVVIKNIPAGANTLTFYSSATANKIGWRVDDVKLVGVK